MLSKMFFTSTFLATFMENVIQELFAKVKVH